MGDASDSAVEAERPVQECCLTTDTEGFRIRSRRFWLYGGGIESHRK